MTTLYDVQKDLQAPKTQWNKFGQYHYRSCEDILGALKPVLNGCKLYLEDEIVMIGERYYVKATARFVDTDGQETVTSAYAREPETTKSGMEPSMITGSSSSFARKYCLNALFLTDDVKDPDTDEYTGESGNAEGKSQNNAGNTNASPQPQGNATANVAANNTVPETAAKPAASKSNVPVQEIPTTYAAACNYIVPFGKAKGQKLEQVNVTNPGLINWYVTVAIENASKHVGFVEACNLMLQGN